MNVPFFFEDSMPRKRDTRLASSPLVSDLRNHIDMHSSSDDNKYPAIQKVTSPQAFNQTPWQPAFSSSGPRGLIHVLGYTPGEGRQGNLITANINFVCQVGEKVLVRLIIGRRAIATQVTELPDQTYGRWQLEGIIPHFSVHRTNTAKVPLAVQALNLQGVPLDHVEFGEYTYWGSDSTSASASNIGIKRPREENRAVDAQNRPSMSPSNTRSPRPTQRHRIPSRLHRRSTLHPGRKNQSATENIEPMAVLHMITPVNPVCLNWDDIERQNGRRLVRFHKVQEGCTLNVTCERIHHADYREGDAVVSCIRRDDDGSHCITSVDIINLLEKLVDEKFEVEEKNRIRRNIEGLKPTPLKKGQPALEDLYTRIMEYPDPKPRNIEKDIKVFDWNILPQALDKIISRYSLVSPCGGEPVHPSEEAAPTLTERGSSTDGSSGASDGESTFEDQSTELQLAYPPEESVAPGNLYLNTVTFDKDYAADLQDVSPTPTTPESTVYTYGISDNTSNNPPVVPHLSSINFDYSGYTSNLIEGESPSVGWSAALVKVEDVEEAIAFDEPLEIQDCAPYDNCGLQTYDSLEFQALREPNVLFGDSFCSV